MLEAIVAGVFGLLIGSFLNVCIYRWPRDLSVVSPRSFCPGCQAQISWYDNIPVLSYLLLLGSCRRCTTGISWRYPAVELLTGLVFFVAVALGGLSAATARDCVFASILIALSVADLEMRILPDQLTLGGLILGLLFAWITPMPAEIARLLAATIGLVPGPRALSLVESALGAVIPTSALWLIGYLFQKVRHKEGLGFGDIKMLAAMGAFLGLPLTLFALVSGSILGSVTGVAYITLARKEMAEYELPLGTFLGIGGLLALTVGPGFLHWYNGFF